MTAQISDRLMYRDCDYSIVGWEGAAPFDPAAYGLEPIMFSTGCWQGYHCAYEVAPAAAPDPTAVVEQPEKLVLTTVFIGLGGEQREAAERGAGPGLFGVVPRYSDSDGCFVYGGLTAELPFSGCLTLGRDFIWDQYVHMGFHPPWKYRTVLDLTFEAGRLVQAVDRSEDMSRLRASVDGGSPLSPFGLLEPPR